MPKYRTVRPVTADEAETCERLARSRTTPARTVERAQIVWQAHQGVRVSVIADRLAIGEATVRRWLCRFNACGLAGLADAPRSGRPATYPPQAVGELIAASLTDPDELGLPFGSWTLDRLAAYLHEERGITMTRSRIGEILVAEGLRWRQQEHWFGERPDPAFAEKRGAS